jgi:hypothetical protein
MQRFVNLCEYLHTFGSGCNVSFARDSVYWSGRTGDEATVVGQYKYPRCTPRGEVVLRVTRFSKGRGATVFSRRGITSRRGSRGARTCRLERHLHRYIVPCRLFSGEDAEKSSTATDQGGDHRVRNSECFSACRTHRRLPHLVLLQLQAQRAIAYGHIGYKPSRSLCLLRRMHECQSTW